MHASTAMRVIWRPAASVSLLRCCPAIHSVTRTRVVEYWGKGTGVVTKPRNSSDASNSAAFAISFS